MRWFHQRQQLPGAGKFKKRGEFQEFNVQVVEGEDDNIITRCFKNKGRWGEIPSHVWKKNNIQQIIWEAKGTPPQCHPPPKN